MYFEEIRATVMAAVRSYGVFFHGKPIDWIVNDKTDFLFDIALDEEGCSAFTVHLEACLGFRLGPYFNMEEMLSVSDLVIWIWRYEIAYEEEEE